MERFITTRDGLELWTESFGEPGDPAILLIMGGTAQGVVWPDTFCRLLAESGHHVVRYDHRDTGRSSSSTSDYDLTTLALDAADVIASLELRRAHVIGQSVGGMAAQLLALEHPELVRTLLLLSSSPDANGDITRPPASGLPGPLPPMQEHVAALMAAPPMTPEEKADAAVAGWRVLVGPEAPFSEPYWRTLVTLMASRVPGEDTAGAHIAALDRTPPLTPRLSSLHVPTSVIHGALDPVFPLAHGRALADAIPGARLVELPDMGHLFPPPWSPLIHALFRDHVIRATAGALVS